MSVNSKDEDGEDIPSEDEDNQRPLLSANEKAERQKDLPDKLLRRGEVGDGEHPLSASSTYGLREEPEFGRDTPQPSTSTGLGHTGNLGPISQKPEAPTCYIDVDSIEHADETEEAHDEEAPNVEAQDENITIQNERQLRLNTDLLIAVDDHNNKEVKRLLDVGANPNATSGTTFTTACHLAAFSNEEALRMLLNAGADRTRYDIMGMTPLHFAAWSNSPRKIAMLLDFPKDLEDKVSTMHWNLTPEGETEMHALGLAFISLLNFRKAPISNLYFPNLYINIPDEWQTTDDCRDFSNFPPLVAQCTALHAASEPANAICVHLLLAAGADPNLADESGSTALDVAGISCPIHYVHSYEETIRILLEYGAKLGSARYPVLEVALHTGSLQALTMLLAAGAPLDRRNSSGQTPLHVCVELKLKEHLQVLCHAGIMHRKLTDQHGNTVLHSAAQARWSEGVSVALEARADITSVNNEGDTALHLAAAAGDYDIVKKLLQADIYKRCNLKQENNDGKSAFANAIYSGNVDIVICMLEHENELKNFLHREIDGMNPLEFAAMKNYHKLFLLILNNQKSELNKQQTYSLMTILTKHDCSELFAEVLKSNFMRYPIKDIIAKSHLLHEAIQNGSRRMILVLLEKGADLSQKNNEGQTALGLLMYHFTKPIEFMEELFDSCIKSNNKNIYDNDCVITVDYRLLLPVEYLESSENGSNNTESNDIVLHEIETHQTETQTESNETESNKIELNETQQNTKVKEMNVLDALIETGNVNGQRRLLAHPLVESFLYLKWKKCNKFIYAFILIYVLFLVSLNIYLVSGYYFESNYELFDDTYQIPPYFDPEIWEICVIVTLIFVCIMECFIWNLKKRWMYETGTWVKFCSLIFGAAMLIISLVMESDDTDWARIIAVCTTALSWINMMIYLSWTPTWGYYMQMYGKVSYEALKIMLIFSIPIICFAICFMILFHAKDPFKDPLAALIKTIVMMTSEFDYKDLVESKNVTYMPLFQIVFMLFLIFVAIVLMNLVTGVAVNDMQVLTREGNLRRLEKQVDRLCMLEILFQKKPFSYLKSNRIGQIPSKVEITPNTSVIKNTRIKEGIMNKAQKLIDLKKEKDEDVGFKTKLDEILKIINNKDIGNKRTSVAEDDNEKLLNILVEKTVEKSVDKILEVLTTKYGNNGNENTYMVSDAQNKYMSEIVEKAVVKAVDAVLDVLPKNTVETKNLICNSCNSMMVGDENETFA